MNLKNAFKSIIKSHEEDVLSPLTTVWGEHLDPSDILSEYPRPQLRRSEFINLNGYWDYAITIKDAKPDSFHQKILVPFSPEASLSGVEHILRPDETLWYRTEFTADPQKLAAGETLLLHFGAVDHSASLFINDIHVTTHQGGYLPFTADITSYLKEGKNILELKVTDGTDTTEQARGKQSLHRGGIFYTSQSGIWQTVFMEWVPFCHIQNLWFETDYDHRKVTAHITARLSAPDTVTDAVPAPFLQVYADGRTLPVHPVCTLVEDACSFVSTPENHQKDTAAGTTGTDASLNTTASDDIVRTFQMTFTIPEEHFHSWTPETPFLYQVTLSLKQDLVESYFAMRLYTMELHDTIPVFCLNHKPYFLMGVLDQGYWPDGLYTAPSDEALIYDITTMKNAGFNMLRKHIKVETARWYYHCDRIGMIVCQDMPNGGGRYSMPLVSYFPTLFPGLTSHLRDSHYRLFSRKDKAMRLQWEKECCDMIEYLKFFPSIAIWCPFNEGWGQFDAAKITEKIQKADPFRLIDSTSGWFDQNCGDFISIHNYFRPLSGITKYIKKENPRGLFLSEYGGFACHIKKHSSLDRIYGYKCFDTLEEFQKAYDDLLQNSLFPLKAQGISGAVYTQLSDVEEEVNGLLTYDRKINKLLP